MPEAGYTKRRGRWSAEEMLAKAREWYETHGEAPTAADWNPSDSGAAVERSLERASRWAERQQRFYDGEYPWTGSVYRVFGPWTHFIREAGLQPRSDSRNPPLLFPTPAGIEPLEKMIADTRERTGSARKAALYRLAAAAIALAEES